MTRAHQGEPERRSVSGRNSLWSDRHKRYRKKAGQANSRDSQISVEWLFGARCRMQCLPGFKGAESLCQVKGETPCPVI